MTDALKTYIDTIKEKATHKEAAEHAYRPALEALLASLGDFGVINDPRRMREVGAPDFILKRGEVPVAFVEAKDIGIDLDKVQKDEQMGRYLPALHNLVLTDYVEFRRFYNGEKVETARLGTVSGKKITIDPQGVESVRALLTNFALAETPQANTPEDLANYMAMMARQIARLIENALLTSASLREQKQSFEETLIPNLSDRQFADMYAQTLAYGLFAARITYKDSDPFKLENAFWKLPSTNPFLKRLFQSIAPTLNEEENKSWLWLVQALANLLAHADTDEILKDFGLKTRQDDPIVHFYETFLSRYDPQQREMRGVYYTPEPVVTFIVKSVDHILKTHFKRRSGLVDENVLVLDPATGTGTFLFHVLRHIHDAAYIGNQGQWEADIKGHLLKRIFGFELLMASYVIAHIKLSAYLKETGYAFPDNQRLGVYLTNTLEDSTRDEGGSRQHGFATFIAQEGQAAEAIKRDKPIMVVLGNPPYSGHSANKSRSSDGKLTWIGRLIQDYFKVDGKPLGERNPKWLNDDYVKFIRFGQWRIDQTGHGVLAFVTNHGYLDNPTFRGMRQQLMDAFTDIYVLDLHGNSKKKERTPDGNTDQNVFDIQQGVAIGIFIKEEGKAGPAQVHHADLWGVRQDKYTALTANDIDSLTWQTLTPQSPYYLFVPQDVRRLEEYQQGWKITEVMAINVLGFQTHRDSVAIAYSKEDLKKQVTNYLTSEPKENDWKTYATQVDYRPFDTRWGYLHSSVSDRSRPELIQNVMGKENLCLLSSRQQANIGYRHVWIAEHPANDCVVSTTSREANQVLPLYLYPNNDLFAGVDDGSTWPVSAKGRRPNLNPAFVKEMESKLGLSFITDGKGDLASTFGPEDVFAYIYAVFHAPTYRERYAEFLKIDFPRVPLTTDAALFRALVEKGAALVDLHLLKDVGRLDLITTYPQTGDDTVTSKGYPRYNETERRVYINTAQYFQFKDEIDAETALSIWEFHVGGYQVAEKWLKDRRGRKIGDDLAHYQKVLYALWRTDALMTEIDAVIPSFPLP